MNTNKEARPTAADLTNDIYVHTADLTRRNDHYGNVELTIGAHRILIGDEYEDQDTPDYDADADEQAIWGWTWTTYERIDEEYAGNRQNWEPVSSSGTQDEAELIADINTWLTQAQA